MDAHLRQGLPAEAYGLGNLVSVVQPSLRSWAIGIFPAATWCLGLTLFGLALALALLSEPFAFLLNMGWAACILPIILPIGGLYILGSHLFRNLRGRIFVLDGGVVLMLGATADAKVYPWTAVHAFQNGNGVPPSQSEAAAATVFAHGATQFTVHMTDGAVWVFGSDLRGFPELQEWFQKKAANMGQAEPPS